MTKSIPAWLFTFYFLCTAFQLSAQNFLSQKISINVRDKPIITVFKMAEKQGGFFFSFNSSLIPEDSLVTLSFKNKDVAYLLKSLFNDHFHYEQHGRYLIIQPFEDDHSRIIRGVITDKNTKERLSNVTIYEKQQLISTMSDQHGVFQLQLKEYTPTTIIHISKLSYQDTLIHLSNASAPIAISLLPLTYLLDSVVVSNHTGIEHSWLGRTLLSSRLRINSLNLGSFLASRPYQFSLVPGLGSHGKMGAQVDNKFSFNLLGGYTAGVHGFELGGLFNVVKNDMQYVEIGGLFNFVGRNVKGVQIAGLANRVLDSTSGLQLSGLVGLSGRSMNGTQIGGVLNKAGNMTGIQIGGLVNITRRKARGFQLAGIVNYTSDISGLQISGIMNFNKKSSEGFQLAGLCNYTKSARGVQLALINIADTLPGYSFGLFNIIRKGYHKLAISYDENNYLSLAFNSGNPKLYNIVKIGTSMSEAKTYSIGYGLGKEIKLNKKFGFNPELSAEYFYPGNWEQGSSLCRFRFNFRYKLGRTLTLSAGPAYSFNYAVNSLLTPEYSLSAGRNYFKTKFNNRISGWLGWNVGLEFF